jgi:SAM-dependent methyltransferase
MSPVLSVLYGARRTEGATRPRRAGSGPVGRERETVRFRVRAPAPAGSVGSGHLCPLSRQERVNGFGIVGILSRAGGDSPVTPWSSRNPHARTRVTNEREKAAIPIGGRTVPRAADGYHEMDTPQETDETVDEAHLARSERVWNRWSDWYGQSERDFAPLLDAAVERLDLEAGDAALEIGCGPGTNLERLRERVGPDGCVLAVDYSPAMVERARERVAEHGWENVEVRRADATRVDLEPAAFDAALAALSMSVMPDASAAAERVHGALRPGARFVVLDLRCVPSGPLRIANPLLSLCFRWVANWNPDTDVVGSLEATFDDATVEETYAAGVCFRASTSKPGAAEDGPTAAGDNDTGGEGPVDAVDAECAD